MNREDSDSPDRRIRVARILGRPNVGGPARTALRLTRALDARGFETLLIVGASDPEEGDLLEGVTDVRIERIAAMRRSIGFSDLFARRRLRELLAAFRPDVVHTHAAKAGALGRRAAFAATPQAKTVHTYHGHSLRGYFPRPIAAVFALVERSLARRTDRLVAVSQRVKHELAIVHRIANEDRIVVIENGIDLAQFQEPSDAVRAAARRLLAPSREGAMQLVVPARLAPIKGHEVLFAALARSEVAGLVIELHLVGDGPSRAALEKSAAKLPKNVVVSFHGFRGDLAALLPGADLVVLPSHNEGMSLALIEAMAAGCAIVATGVGGTPDLIEDGATGLLVPGGDPTALAKVIARALADGGLRARLARSARERALSRHSIERVVDAHEALYRELLLPLPLTSRSGHVDSAPS